jgi:hypothetical protein
MIMVLNRFFDFKSPWLARICRPELDLKWTSDMICIVSVEEFVLGTHPSQLQPSTFISAVSIG